jgi:hypothetical protein
MNDGVGKFHDVGHATLEQIEANQILTVAEGRGITQKQPFKRG